MERSSSGRRDNNEQAIPTGTTSVPETIANEDQHMLFEDASYGFTQHPVMLPEA